MDKHVLQQAKEVGVQAAREAGQLARSRFDQQLVTDIKDEYGDVVTEVDYAMERIILDQLRAAFPHHQMHSEEAGWLGEASDWLWMIDPLDGTNNYAIGLSLYATSLTLLYKRSPVVGIVYEPMAERMFVSVAGEGTTCNGIRVAVKQNPVFARGNIGWIQGHAVRHDPVALQLRSHIDQTFKRMMRLWAPTIQWCMLAKGDIDGIVLYRSEGDDLYGGIVMVQEAGAIVCDFEGNPFTTMTEEPRLIACHPAHRDALLAVVQEGLSRSGKELAQ